MQKTEFSIDKKVFGRETVLRTCYRFTGDYHIDLTSPEEDIWHVAMVSSQSGKDMDSRQLEGEFRNLLIDEAFRESLTEKTRTIKEIFVAKALFGADAPPAERLAGAGEQTDFSFIEEEMDNYLEDPLGIAVPWEEKQAGKEDPGLE